jgi:hypothetical protein
VHFAFCTNVLVSNCIIDGGFRLNPDTRVVSERTRYVVERRDDMDNYVWDEPPPNMPDEIGTPPRSYAAYGRQEALKVNQCKYV